MFIRDKLKMFPNPSIFVHLRLTGTLVIRFHSYFDDAIQRQVFLNKFSLSF